MKILKQTSDEVYVMDNPKAPRFVRFEAAFGWMEQGAKDARKAIHAFMVGGEQEDGKLVVFEEWIGNLHDVVGFAIDAKDRLWLPRIHVDGRDRDYIVQLYDEGWADGLTRYIKLGDDIHGRPVYSEKNPTERWRNFHDYDTKASLVPVPEFVLVGLAAGMGRMFSSMQNRDLLVHETCKELLWCREQKTPAEIVDHPVIRASVMLTWALVSKKKKETAPSKTETTEAWGNLRKG